MYVSSSSVSPLRPPAEPVAPQPPAGGSFANLLQDSIQSVAESQKTASEGVQRFMAGETEDLHRIALDRQRAALQFDLFLQVRNKVVQAYQEVMRSQI
jgi:flagellar hook-basal body complex protein FliE